MMSEENTLHLEGNETFGDIVIAPEVIEVIVGIAASKVSGVYAMQGSFTDSVAALFARNNAKHSKGVYLKMDEEGITVDIYCYLQYGVAVPKVALDMQEKVKQQVLFMTDIALKEVNVHVEGVIPEKVETPNLEELMKLEDEDEE